MCYYVKFRISNVGVFLIYEAFRNWAANFNALLAFAQSGGVGTGDRCLTEEAWIAGS